MFAAGGDRFYLGNVGRIPVYVSVEALILLLFVYMVTPPSHFGIDGYLLSLFALLLSIVLHELGHAAVAAATGLTGVTITLAGTGGYCTYSGEPSPGKRLPITLAGVTVNGLLWWLMHIITPHVVGLGIQPLALFVLFFGFWNMLGAIFNVLPIYPLDGGQALYQATQLGLSPMTARRVTLSVTVAAALAVVVYFAQNGGLGIWNAFLLYTLVTQAFRDLR